MFKKVVEDFKKFAIKGNVIDLAVGVIIGASFGKIVSSLVNDIIMPPIGLAINGIDFKHLGIVLKEATLDAKGKILKEAVTINYGMFIQNVIDFIIVAFCIFLLVKLVIRLSHKEEEKKKEPSTEEHLLTEIRDILKDIKQKE